MPPEDIKPVDDQSTETPVSNDAGNEWAEFLDDFEEPAIDESVVDEVIEGLNDKPTTGEDDVPPAVETPAAGAEVTPPADTPEASGEDDDLDLEIPPPATPEVTPPSGDSAQYREQYKQQLVEGYSLSAEEAEAFELNPAEALPKFAAELHLRVLENVMATVQNVIPNTMQTLMVQTETAKRNETEFFEHWPELQGHQSLIGQKASEFRKANPQASKEDAIRMVGFNTLVALGVDPVQAAERLRRGVKQKAAAPAPAPKPHVPAAATRQGSANRSAPPSTPSIWQEMVEDY